MKYIICICDECSHAWLTGVDVPARCAKCRCSTWDGRAKLVPGRPRKVAAQPAKEFVPGEIIETTPVEEESVADRRPKTRQSKAKMNISTCPHNMTVVDGITACKRCKSGK